MNSSAGSLVRSSRKTVNPPTPESNTPIGNTAPLTRLRDFGAHVREQQDVAYRRGVGEKHHEPIDADAEPAGRRHSVSERPHVVRVVIHRLFVALALARGLILETLRLILGVIEFGKAVVVFTPADEEFEAIGDERILVVAPRERRDLGRIAVGEGRLDERVLAGALEQFDLQLAGAVTALERNFHLFADAPQITHVAQRHWIEVRIVA